MADTNYEQCVREHFQRTEGRIVKWRYTGDRHGLYEGIVPEDFTLPPKATLDALWTTLEAERTARETAAAQRKADARELIGAKAQTALANIDQDIIDLAAATTLAQIRPIVDRMLKRQRGIIKALMFFEDLT